MLEEQYKTCFSLLLKVIEGILWDVSKEEQQELSLAVSTYVAENGLDMLDVFYTFLPQLQSIIDVWDVMSKISARGDHHNGE